MNKATVELKPEDLSPTERKLFQGYLKVREIRRIKRQENYLWLKVLRTTYPEAELERCITCPKCAHKSCYHLGDFIRGLSYLCRKCDCRFTIL